MKLVLSPMLHQMCSRSREYRWNYRHGQLNVCNVIRSLLYVLLCWTALPTLARGLVANALLQLGFVMWKTHTWSPWDAMDFLVYSLRLSDWTWDSPQFWVSLASVCLSGLFVIFVTGVVFVVPTFFTLWGLWSGLKKVLGSSTTERAAMTGVVREYIASKHSKFCVNISSTVKKTYAENLQERMEAQTVMHWNRLQRMSKEELLASIERNRAILAKYV